jgi:hypothetical protein
MYEFKVLREIFGAWKIVYQHHFAADIGPHARLCCFCVLESTVDYRHVIDLILSFAIKAIIYYSTQSGIEMPLVHGTFKTAGLEILTLIGCRTPARTRPYAGLWEWVIGGLPEGFE